MSIREKAIAAVDLLVWAGSGALILVFATLLALAIWRGKIVYGTQRITKLDNPVDYLFVLAVYCGCIYFLWLTFQDGLSTWLAR